MFLQLNRAELSVTTVICPHPKGEGECWTDEHGGAVSWFLMRFGLDCHVGVSFRPARCRSHGRGPVTDETLSLVRCGSSRPTTSCTPLGRSRSVLLTEREIRPVLGD